MAVISNYATLQQAVADYLARDDLTTFIPNFIQNVENKLNRSLNLRNEETALSVSISSGVAAVPSDFKALKFAYFDASPATVLQSMPVEDLYRKWPTRSGATTPVALAREADNFTFGPYSKDGTLKGVYWAKQLLTRNVDTTWYVTEAPEVLLYGALMEAQPFIQGDERIIIWQQLFKDAFETLRKAEDASIESQGHLLARVS